MSMQKIQYLCAVIIETFRLRVYVYGNVNGNSPRSA